MACISGHIRRKETKAALESTNAGLHADFFIWQPGKTQNVQKLHQKIQKEKSNTVI